MKPDPPQPVQRSRTPVAQGPASRPKATNQAAATAGRPAILQATVGHASADIGQSGVMCTRHSVVGAQPTACGAVVRTLGRMGEFLPFLVVTGALAAVMGFFAWLASLVRRRGLAGAAVRAAMASYDEAFRVTAHDAHYEIQAQADRKVPMALPGDPWRPIRGGDGPAGERGPLQRRPRRLWRGLRGRVRRSGREG